MSPLGKINRIVSLNLSRACTERYYVPWLYSRLRFRVLKHNTLIQNVPWICYEARKWLSEYLTPDMTVFEYGSGGSTIFISKRVKRIISVEAFREWYDSVSEETEKQHVSNCDQILIEPKYEAMYVESHDGLLSPPFNDHTIKFERYVKSITSYPDESFDLVFIDGQARISCVYYAREKVRPGGFIMFDNFEEEAYTPVAEYFEGWDSRKFYGLVPTNHNPSETTIWKKPLS